MCRFKLAVLGFMSLGLLACTAPAFMSSSEHAERLAAVIEARSAEAKARDASRHPQQTLMFFGLEPGMTVVEVLPGGGWYTQIIAPYLGSEGALYGVNYADNMWSRFGVFSDEGIAQRIASSETFAGMVNAVPGAEGVVAKGYAFDRIDTALNGTVDRVIMIRALHNLNRFEKNFATRTDALQQLHALLKPGGIVGVVQHRAPASASDDWASGKNGYLKEAAVIAMFEQQGFKLQARSEMNANPRDQPGEGDYVWRLPPSLRTAPENKAAMQAIGESDRMTLTFVKLQDL